MSLVTLIIVIDIKTFSFIWNPQEKIKRGGTKEDLKNNILGRKQGSRRKMERSKGLGCRHNHVRWSCFVESQC